MFNSLSGPTADAPAVPVHALNALIEAHSAAAYRLAKSIVRDHAMAEDVVQDTLIKAWRALPNVRGGPEVLRSWVLRIAHNTAVSALRKVRDVAVDPEAFREYETAPSEAAMFTHDLKTALDTLSPTTRAVVVLRDVEGYSYQEIAEIMQIEMPTVKTRLFRGRRQLCGELEEWRT